MRKLSLLCVFIIIIGTNICKAQGTVTLFAGNGTSGSSGDGGPASAAAIGVPYCITFDVAGNAYIIDNNHGTVRKVDASGTISTVAGNGSIGYSGDNGPATAAQTDVANVTVDASGNLYIADGYNNVVRKVNTSGIITTIAGNGTNSYSGDGGPATAAGISQIFGIAVDAAGNVYLSDYSNNAVRKVNTAGIITTIAGNGTAGYSGDGGPATTAELYSPRGLALDAAGDLYVVDVVNYRVRKVSTSGIITTIAGNGFAGFSGDGGPAINAQIAGAFYVAVSSIGDVYFTDPYNYRVRKVNTAGIISTVLGSGTGTCTGIGGPALSASVQPVALGLDHANILYATDDICYDVYKVQSVPTVIADSFSMYVDNLCNGVNVTAVTNSSSSLSVQVSFGDAFSVTTPLSPSAPGQQAANTVHSYAVPGTYLIKMVLLNGTNPIDSATYSYNCLLCNTLPLRFYYDANGNCAKDSLEPYNYLPVTTEVDSNGVAVDTISATGGLDYTANGNVGDIYTFRILSTPAGMYTTCLTGGVVTDTLQIGAYNSESKVIALSCSSATGFDLAEYTGSQCGRHLFTGDIIINNTYCNATTATLTAQVDSKYNFTSSYPAPTTVAGGTITWVLSDVSATNPQPHIHFSCEVPGAWLTPGDTVQTGYVVTPTAGDINPGNNTCDHTDTVKSSYDPNEMSVTPSGNILAGTVLQYTINFENTGNAPAQNIYVMDTLSDNVDVKSLSIVSASAYMNTIPIKAGGHNIIKFDFPGIHLLDSSHHDQCNGMVTFNINTKLGLPYGTTIFNHAGIFFDDNPVVMTDTVEDMIYGPDNFPAIKNAHLQIYPNPATDQLTIKMDNNAYSSCIITNTMGQSLITQPLSGTQTNVNIQTLPAGLYYITVTGDNGSKVQKFVKM